MGAARVRGSSGRDDVCPTGKVGYSSRGIARKALKTIGRKDMRAYLCDACHLWHLTSARSGR
jgi:hypothetical protein